MKKISLFFRKVLIKIIEFYQKHISKVLAHGGINCKFYPTCS
ncbi:MAG: membrane protein insertion efficiency factor YidD, partial [Clostridia bacterium]|nr:membrane protein insertion efficiency factor YidD [Clostridia bacterium]